MGILAVSYETGDGRRKAEDGNWRQEAGTGDRRRELETGDGNWRMREATIAGI